MTPGGIFSGDTIGNAIGYAVGDNQVIGPGYACIAIATCQGVKPICPLAGSKGFSYPDQGCWQYYSGLSASPARSRIVKTSSTCTWGSQRETACAMTCSSCGAARRSTTTSIQPRRHGAGQRSVHLRALQYTAAAPTCGPETIAPGLTVNGCTSVGQIIALENPNLFYTKVHWIALPSPDTLSVGTHRLRPDLLGYGDNVAYNVPFGTPIASSTTNIKAPGVYMSPNTPAHAFDGPIPQTTKESPTTATTPESPRSNTRMR